MHGGERAEITLRPAPVNSRILFRRIDLNPIVEIPALAEHVGDTRLSTTLMKDDVRVATVEHLIISVCWLRHR